MAVYNQLKYGTLVLSVIGAGVAFFYSAQQRLQIYAIDCIEIAEGVRERQLIVSSITLTNTFNLQIATNRAVMSALDDEIITLIPSFVNQEELSTWAASGSTNYPDNWTVSGLLSHVGIGGTDFPDYPLQVKKSDLQMRYDVLKHLVYTAGDAAWGAQATVYYTNISYGTEGFIDNTNFPAYYPGDNGPITNQSIADAKWAELDMDNLAEGLDWYESSHTDELDLLCILGSPYSTYLGGYSPYYEWSYSGHFNSFINFGATIFASVGQNWWARGYGIYQDARGSISTTLRAMELNGWGPSIDLPRVDMFYDEDSHFEDVEVAEFTEVTATTGRIGPTPTWGGTNVSVTVAILDEVYWEPPRDPDYGYRILSRSSTNAEVNVSSSYTSPDLLPRPVIHKWTVERCVP
jgi:hypothetical protein